MISDQHQIPRRKATIDPARGVAHDQRTRPEALHEGRREGDGAHVVAFVVVEASLHGHHRHALDASDHQPAGVPGDGRRREMRQIAVIDGHRIGHPLDQLAQSGTEDDTDRRPQIGQPLDAGHRLFEFSIHSVHCSLPSSSLSVDAVFRRRPASRPILA